MKGFFKGFKFFSQMFDQEEEEEVEEIQIGLPTDVKHVAHIGFDGPAVSSPSWMTEFKESPDGASAPVQGNGSASGQADDVNRGSQDSTTKKSRDLPSLPKSSRRKSSMDNMESVDSPPGSPTQKSKPNHRRRQSKSKECTSPPGGESSNPPNIPKKGRRKKSKDSDGSVKSKSKDKGSRHGPRNGSDDGSVRQFSAEDCSSPPRYGAQ